MKSSKILRRLTVAVILSLAMIVITPASVLAAPVIEVSPLSGSPGTKVAVSATNFESYRGDTLSIFFGDREVDSVVVPENGVFTAEFVVPDDAQPGRFYVTIRDELGNQLGTRRPFIVEETDIQLYPTDGAVGTMVTVTGAGFYASGVVTIYYDGKRADGGTTTASPVGEFSYSFAIPLSTGGAHSITAKDSLGNWDKASFKVTPAITISPSSAAIGDRVTVSGTGFGASSDVIIYFDGVEVAVGQSDGYGSFEFSFDVPVMERGSRRIVAEDTKRNIAEAGFTVVAGATLIPSAGNVGTPLTVSGVGFISDGSVTINYDGVQVATATAGVNGTFSVTFPVPASIGGGHTVTINDGTNEVKRIFTMESEAPPAPALLVPEDGAKASAEAYLDWEDVTDPSGVTYTLNIATDDDFSNIVLEKKGLTESEYTLTLEEKLPPSKKEAPYYWRVRAVDGASNQSDWSTPSSFYVPSRFALTVTARNALIGAGVAGAIFFGFWLGRRTAYSQ